MVLRIVAAIIAIAMSWHSPALAAAAGTQLQEKPATYPKETLVYDRRRAVGKQGLNWAEMAALPVWTGAWGLDSVSFMQGMDAATGQDANNPNMAPLTREWEAKRMANGAANRGRGPDSGVINNSAFCIPNGMPGLMGAPFAFQFVYSPGEVIIIPENNSVRRIYTDGRGHERALEPTFNGHSIGYWVGEQLMVETVMIKPSAEFFMGLKTSGETKVIERMRRTGPTTFQIDFTVTDSQALLRPFNYTRTYQLSSAGMVEYYCTENNRDSNGFIDLTPPPE